MRPVYIIGSQRTPFVKSFTYYTRTTNQDMLTETLKNLVNKFQLDGKILGDIALGALIKRSSDWNLARESVLGTSLHPSTPAYNVQRACGTSLDTSLQIALKIAAGQIDVGIAGGSDTNSDLPVMFSRKFAWKLLEARGAKGVGDRVQKFLKMNFTDLKPEFPGVMEPRTGLSMGQHCEKMVKEWHISQREQDEIALMSHKNAAKAQVEGFFDDLVFEFKGLKKDPLVRGDTTLEKMAKLKPAFDFSGNGTLTAANSTPLTDGAAAVLMCSSEYAQSNGYKPLAKFVDAQSAAVDFVNGEGLLMAPTRAVSDLLKRNNLSLQDFDYYEIHEAFAGQVACTLRAWESAEFCKKKLGRDAPMGSIDRTKMNIKGGSVAIGHPFAATGARIVGGLAKMLSQKKNVRGLISVCTAGGMGVAAILESVN